MLPSDGRVRLTSADSLTLLQSVTEGRLIGSRNGLPDAFPIHYWCTGDEAVFAPSEEQRFLRAAPVHRGHPGPGPEHPEPLDVMAVGPASLRRAAVGLERTAWDGSRLEHLVVVVPVLLSGVAVARHL